MDNVKKSINRDTNKFKNKNIDYKKKQIWKISSYTILVILTILFMIPIVWMFGTSLKPAPEVITVPPTLIGSRLQWQNYVTAWTSMDFNRFLINSLIVSGSVTLIASSVSSLSGYAFARIEFKGRDTFFLFYLATLMIPVHVTIIPLFIIMRELNWIDTYAALIFPISFTAFGTFLLRQSFLTIPYELEEAGRIDGCGHFLLFTRIMLPMVKPAISTLAIFTFVSQWKNFLWPLIVVNSNTKMTITLGLNRFQGQYGTDWHLMMAAAGIAIIPSILIYVLLQRYLVEGISLTGMGGR